MAMDPNLSSLLKWSVENSSTPSSDPSDPSDPSTKQQPPRSTLTPEALSALLGGPSDADLMLSSMTSVLSTDPSLTLSDKLTAFDNFEQLIENLDNANNLAPLSLWTPLLSCLSHEEGEIRRMAAWCVGTAVQNNVSCQERLLAMGGVEMLLKLAMDAEAGEGVRRKAVYAVSSAVRNYQPGVDVLTTELGKLEGWKEFGEKVDAGDMEAVDVVIEKLREEAMS
ncbi:nucleotide exchange factor Fes1-domain-containing protein [Amylocarpus encephaloides]|uniref:Nucleotide exchange factor Fes1-domain-containing protein n=1 Tax=Amylocarpus encephaloides TaxID=45428 RepID=A0A9P7YFK9_9HELO|nr:nucleotide exchange factor Fes1-domain-containing protein [Amylocarpus encephaloides]